MTRKDYEALAAAIKQTGDDPGSYDPGLILRDVAERIADACAANNERFDRERFLTACGLGFQGFQGFERGGREGPVSI